MRKHHYILFLCGINKHCAHPVFYIFSLWWWRRKSWMLNKIPPFNYVFISPSIRWFHGIQETSSRTGNIVVKYISLQKIKIKKKSIRNNMKITNNQIMLLWTRKQFIIMLKKNILKWHLKIFWYLCSLHFLVSWAEVDF